MNVHAEKQFLGKSIDENFKANKPVCPRCNEKLAYLIAENKVVNHFHFDGEKFELVEGLTTLEDFQGFKFKCPECNEELFPSEEEGRSFLKNERSK